MSQNPPISKPVTGERREKMGWVRPNDDGTIDIIMYYPNTDTFKKYTAKMAYEIVGDGIQMTEDVMIAEMSKPAKADKWHIGKILYYFRTR